MIDDPHQLTDKERKRLAKLANDWESAPPLFSQSLTASDLRLMFNHYPPLRILLKRIIRDDQGEGNPEFGRRTVPVESLDMGLQDVPVPAVAEKLGASALDYERLQKECARLQKALDSASEGRKELEATISTLNRRYSDQINRLQDEYRICQDRIRELEGYANKRHAALKALESLPEVARHMELEALPADGFEALIQCVAVLSQKDNVLRLWDALAEELRRSKRSVGADGDTLLSSAVRWYNMNWETRQWRLGYINVGSVFDFNVHQRASISPTGETIAELWLPSLLDSTGQILRKAVVVTK